MIESPPFRLLIAAVLAAGLLFAATESSRRPEPQAWCDLSSASCFERSAMRISPSIHEEKNR